MSLFEPIPDFLLMYQSMLRASLITDQSELSEGENSSPNMLHPGGLLCFVVVTGIYLMKSDKQTLAVLAVDDLDFS